MKTVKTFLNVLSMLVTLCTLSYGCDATTNIEAAKPDISKACGEKITVVDLHEYDNRVEFTHDYDVDITKATPEEMRMHAFETHDFSIVVHRILLRYTNHKPFGYTLKVRGKVFCKFFFENDADTDPKGQCFLETPS